MGSACPSAHRRAWWFLDQPDEVEALRDHGPPVHVISHGKLVDAAKMHAIVAAGAASA
jgi:hypothetical protein